jgi:hypothetical protein
MYLIAVHAQVLQQRRVRRDGLLQVADLVGGILQLP